MEWYRIFNLITQGIYLPLHLIFIIGLIRNRRSSPIWQLFIVIVSGLWVMVSGRFLETIYYMFVKENNFYKFAVYYQLVGTTIATFSFLLWNMYLAKYDKLASSKIFKAFLCIIAFLIIIIIVTNDLTHLFYTKLVGGEPVEHGKLFYVCLLLVYGALFIGYIISLIHIIKHGKDKIKRIIVFSMYPLLLAIAALVRSITKVDEVDFTPIIMFLSIGSLYLIVFKYRYISFVNKTKETILEKIDSIIIEYDLDSKDIIYQNKEVSKEVINYVITNSNKEDELDLIDYQGKKLKASITRFDKKIIIVLNDITEIYLKQKELDEQIEKLENLILELNEKKNEINTYIDSIDNFPDLRNKALNLKEVEEKTIESMQILKKNLLIIKERKNDISISNLIYENIEITKDSILLIRNCLNELKEC